MNDSKASELNHASLLIGEKHYPLSSTSTLVGRHLLSDVYIDDPSVSSHHAMIKKGDEGFMLVDMDSMNGTFVNGEMVCSPTILSSHDQVCFGFVEAILVIQEKQVSSEPVSPPQQPYQKKDSASLPLPFSWWPRNKIISRLAAVFFGVLFILRASLSFMDAVIFCGILYLLMTGVRYAKYLWLSRSGVTTSSVISFFKTRPVLAGMMVCLLVSFIALMGSSDEKPSNSSSFQRNGTGLSAADGPPNFFSNDYSSDTEDRFRQLMAEILNQQKQSVFDQVHPVGTATQVVVHDLVVTKWSRHHSNRRLPQDALEFEIRYTLNWKGPIKPDGYTKIRQVMDLESLRVIQTEILATDATVTNEDVANLLLFTGDVLLTEMLRN